MTVNPDTLEHLILYQANDDWLEVGSADAYARDFETEPAKRKVLLMGAVRRLAVAGYIRIGDLEYREPEQKTGLHWAEWPGTIDTKMARLDRVYTPEIEERKDWYWACWLELTDAGRLVLANLPEPDDRFFEGLL